MHHKDSAPFVLFIVIHVLISLSRTKTVSAAEAYSPCSFNQAKRAVDCTELGLHSVPRNLPGNTEILDLSKNEITALFNTSFNVCKRLQILVIDSNNISFIDSGTFLSLPFLQSLDLSFNKYLPTLRGHMFASTNLTNIALNYSGLTYLTEDLFTAMTSPSTLSVFGNRLQNVNWTNCNDVVFLSVSLAFNIIKELSEESFVMTCNVGTLHLNNNLIGPVNPNTISSLIVRNLYMDSNQLTDKDLQHLMEGVRSSETITSLYIRDDGLSPLRRGQFDAFHGKQLRVLDLSANRIKHLIPGGFENLTDVTELRLNQNKLYMINPIHFSGMHHLRVLSLKHNDIFLMNFEGRVWNVHLTTLILRANTFPLIGAPELNGLNGLEVLDLSQNDFAESWSTIPPLTKGLNNLHNLILESNKIRRIPINFLSDTIQLRELSFAYNDLTFLHENLFLNVVNLTRLDLSSNRLVILQFTTFKPILQTLSVLGLRQNQWACNCSLQWLPKWIAKRSITLEDSGETQCSYEGSFKTAAGEPLIDFDPVKECGPQYVLYLSVAASLVCATLALILIYYNRWKIRYGLFLCKIHFIGYREIIPQQQREDYQYDMCVIIYDEDEEWANDVFRRGLEENLPEYGRVAIGDEALRLEMYYLDSVSRLVETSFKVIFLISADALKNHMFLLKFRLALDHVNEVQMEKIVLVFLEDIPDADMPFLIRLFLSDNRAYLIWPQDPEGQACFWDKLAKYMTVNRYCNPLVPP
ncbi:toll-like receptor 7 [Diadema setosum]|uniref:toll-like receptor 7 n=1 Tax=Diadema setosum TaxID=31175 RepID=UPI003B3A8DE5